MPSNRYAFIIFQRLQQLDREAERNKTSATQLPYNWVTQIKIGLLPFGLDGLITILPEDFNRNYGTALSIIEKHFADHDDYMINTCQAYEQYQSFFTSSKEEEEITTAQPDTRNKQKRWDHLPWYLKTDDGLNRKRLIAQLRQNSVWQKFNGQELRIPHPSEEKQCKLCNTGQSDEIAHVLFSCPVTSIAKEKLEEWSWDANNFYEKLEELSTKEVWHQTLRQSFETRQSHVLRAGNINTVSVN